MFDVELFNYRIIGEVAEWGVMQIEASCPTDLANKAYHLQKEFRAELVNFGQAIERFEDGSPAYPKEKKQYPR